MRRAMSLLAAAILAAAGPPAALRAQDPTPPADAQQPAAASPLDGLYRLSTINGSALPVSTQSSYGVIRGAALAIKGRRYAVQYVYGSGQRLRITGRLTYRQDAGTVEFRPTSAGVSNATASYANQALSFSLPNTFGFGQADLVFQYSGPLPPPRQTGAVRPGDAPGQVGAEVQPVQGQTIEPYQAQPVQPTQGQTIEPAQAQVIQPYQAQTIEPAQAQVIQPYQAQTIEAAQAQTVQPYQAQTIQPVQGQSIQPYPGQTIQPMQPQQYPPQSPPAQAYPPAQGYPQPQAQSYPPTQAYPPVQGYPQPQAQAYPPGQGYPQPQPYPPAQPNAPAYPQAYPPPSARPPQPYPAAPAASAPACPASRSGNLVEPLSNGLALSSTLNEIKERFGEGSSGWDPNTVSWSGFSVVAGASDGRLWHFHITSRGICLNSGVTIGSSQDDVKRAFGSTYGATYDQYKLTFNYSGGRVSKIDIDPVREFKPVRGGSARPAPGPGSSNNSTSSTSSGGGASGGAGALAGTWYGSNVVTQITIKTNGTYTSPNGGAGRWTLKGDQLHFTGPLTGWNGGNATFKNGNIEFYWTNPNGAINYFALIKGR